MGILLGDTLNTSFAAWLKGELETRFPGLPVRWVIYSHSHWDHAEGGAVFAADFLADALVRDDMHSLPSACGPFDGHPLSEWIASYRVVESLDFDTLAAGHGVFFTKQDVTDTREYFEYLVDEVSRGMSAGLGLEELKATLSLERYRNWAWYDRLREKNVEAAYRNLTLYR